MATKFLGPLAISGRDLVTHAETVAVQGSPAVGTARVTKPPLQIVTGTHQAFPGVCKRADGSLYMVWRSGSAHTSFDGVVRSAFSMDKGRTWSTPVTIVTPVSGTDLRDPSVSASADGSKMWLTYFKAVSGTPGAGVFFRVSTDQGVSWGSEVRVDASITSAAVCAPVIELDSSTLMLPYYGYASGSFDGVWVAKSTNGGSSWTNTLLINGATDSRHYQEPVGVKRGNTVILFYRYGNAASIGSITSTNNTSSWGANTSKFTGQGRSNPIWFSGSTLAVVYRSLSSPKSVMVRYSRDSGATFYPPVTLDVPPSGGMMTYADLVEVNPNQAFMSFCQETSSGTSSTLYGAFLTIGGGSTPLGNAPGDSESLVDEYDNLIYGTKFDQPNGNPDARWTVSAGSWSVTDGELSNAQSATVGYIFTDFGIADVELEADLKMVDFTGIALMGRFIDSANYITLTCETPTGGGSTLQASNIRLYCVVSGQTTTSVTLASPVSANAWNRFRLTVKGSVVHGSINGTGPVSLGLTSAQVTALGGATKHGLRFNNNNLASASHRCRRFLVRI